MELPDGIVLSCKSFKLDQDEINFFKMIKPLGFVLFKRNFKNKEQIVKLIAHLKSISMNPRLLIFIDQEGGRVQRLCNKEFTKFPPQKIFGDFYKKNKKLGLDLAYKSSYLMGYELKKIGIDVDFSPVCDLLIENAHKIIGDRSFGSSPELVSDLTKTFCKGLGDSGIIPVPKHFPGHGRSIHDTHLDSSVIAEGLEKLKETDLVPYSILNSSSMVMLAHIIYSKIDCKVATYSSRIINEILRLEYKFKGLVLSDDISMKALDDNLVSKVDKSYAAGCNVILYCKGDLNEEKLIYPHVKVIDEKYFDFFYNDLEKKVFKKKNLKKFKGDLLEYNLIKI